MAAENAKDMAIGFVSGINGGIATVYVGQPLDTVKVKMQTFPDIHKNAFRCFANTFRKDGIWRGLYAGTLPALAANVAENSVLFCAYAPCQKVVLSFAGLPSVTEMQPWHNAIAGSLAAFWCALVLCPTELVKCRMQALREMAEMGTLKVDPKEIGPWRIIRQIVREDGIRGFSRGMVPTFGREMPGYFFFFGGYELCRNLFTPKGGCKDDIGPVKTAVCGGVGGVALWTAIFPMDVIKSRMQISATKGGERISTPQMLLQIARQEGIGALYKGLGPTVVRTFPATGALFVAYEYTKRSLHRLSG